MRAEPRYETTSYSGFDLRKMAVRLHLCSAADAAGSAGGVHVSVALDKKTTLAELKSLVAEQDQIKTKSVMI